jgi:hypothetical protein
MVVAFYLWTTDDTYALTVICSCVSLKFVVYYVCYSLSLNSSCLDCCFFEPDDAL